MVSRTICVVTGSRADFGLYRWIAHELQTCGDFTVELAVTGMHLASGFGASLAEVEEAGLTIGWRIDTLLSSDGTAGMAKSVGLGVLGFADAWANRRPDLVLVLGDRFEMLAAVQAAFLLHLPIAHIGGGDVTEGALDDSIRHAISKMAHLHFVTNALSGRRLVRMGERPDRVHMVGSPGVDAIRRLELLDRAQTGMRADFQFRRRNAIVTFHPVTLDHSSSAVQFQAMLDALADLGPDTGILMTMPNADAEGRSLADMAQRFADLHPNVTLRTSLGQLLYLSAVACADVVAGNSSSGLYEAPALGTPTVNVGRRQDGRLRAASVIDCPPERGAIRQAMEQAFALGRGDGDSPYGQGDTALRIRDVLRAIPDFDVLTHKGFYDPPDA